ncbi:MAG: ABC transporter ATP-binding protein [Tissierellia bacterium]|nr:ABC transporter ATP-binding protein [Tissierellia bacterium]
MELTLNQVSFSYGEKTVIRDFSMEIEKGSVVVLLGPNGSGKTTLLDIMGGFIEPNRGEVYLQNKRISSYTIREKAKRISYVGQLMPIAFEFEVEDVVGQGRYAYKRIFEPFSARDQEAVEQALNLCGLMDFRKRRMNELSGGEMKRVMIARSIAQDADILLLDEPLNNLDLKYQAKLLKGLLQYNREKKKTMIVSLHDINIAHVFGQEFLYMKNEEMTVRRKKGDHLSVIQLEDIYDTQLISKELDGEQIILPKL